MTYVLLIVASLLAIAGLARPAGYIKAPTLMAGVFAAWFAVQLMVVSNDEFAPQDAVFSVALLGLLCVLAIYVGWHYGVRRPVHAKWRDRSQSFSVEALTFPVLMITIFTTVINLYLNQLRSTDAGQMQQWTGPITIVAFFANLRIIPLVLSLLMVLQKRTTVTIGLAILNLAVTLPVAFLFLRRSEMAEIGIAVLGALWFARRYKVRLPIVLAGAAIFAVVVFGMGNLRKTQSQLAQNTESNISIFSPELWKSVEVGESVSSSLDQAPDVRNAVYLTKHTNDYRDFSYGASVWNAIVFQYVPAQIFGRDFKFGLMLGERNIPTETLKSNYQFKYQTGTTSTGVGSSYRDFGYFGFIYFLFIGYLMAIIYRRAMLGNPWMQTAYIAILPLCLTMITHGHDQVFVNLPIFFLVLYALRLITRRKMPKRGAKIRGRLSVARAMPSTHIPQGLTGKPPDDKI